MTIPIYRYDFTRFLFEQNLSVVIVPDVANAFVLGSTLFTIAFLRDIIAHHKGIVSVQGTVQFNFGRNIIIFFHLSLGYNSRRSTGVAFARACSYTHNRSERSCTPFWQGMKSVGN
jgi:hypothetical protein